MDYKILYQLLKKEIEEDMEAHEELMKVEDEFIAEDAQLMWEYLYELFKMIETNEKEEAKGTLNTLNRKWYNYFKGN